MNKSSSQSGPYLKLVRCATTDEMKKLFATLASGPAHRAGDNSCATQGLHLSNKTSERVR